MVIQPAGYKIDPVLDDDMHNATLKLGWPGNRLNDIVICGIMGYVNTTLYSRGYISTVQGGEP